MDIGRRNSGREQYMILSTWSICFFHHDGASGQRARKELPRPQSLPSRIWYVTAILIPSALSYSLFLVIVPRVTNESIKEATFRKKEKGDVKRKDSLPLLVQYDQVMPKLLTDGWTIISWLVTWGCLVDSSSFAHILQCSCHILCLCFPSTAPLVGIAFYWSSGRAVQSDVLSDGDARSCVSLLSSCTLVDQIDNICCRVSSSQNKLTDSWLTSESRVETKRLLHNLYAL